jgi:hypothetical protein
VGAGLTPDWLIEKIFSILISHRVAIEIDPPTSFSVETEFFPSRQGESG